MNHPVRPGQVIAVSASLYGVWLLATYVLEGYPRTLLRPEATGLRVAYAVVANIMIGIVGGAWLASQLVRYTGATPARLGFHRPVQTLVAAGIGGGLGSLVFLIQRPPQLESVSLANIFAQVLVVSVSEVIICWVVVGNTVETALRRHGPTVAAAGGLAAASTAFGVYHVAHSPPFNSVTMVIFLTGIGCLTGVVYLSIRDVYATIAFHNFLGVTGVAGALEPAVGTGPVEQFRPPLFVMAVLAVIVLAICHRLWLWDSSERAPNRASVSEGIG